MKPRVSWTLLALAGSAAAFHVPQALPRAAWARGSESAALPRRRPPVALAVPSIGAAAVWPVAAASGAVAAAAQLALVARFRRSTDEALSSEPGLRAYRIVAFAFTLLLAIVGSARFFNPATWPADAATAMLQADGTVRFLGAVLFGELLLWDLPCAIWIKKLRRPDLLIHHIGLAIGPALVASRFLPVFYYAWYIGVSETSSVFLAGNDFFAELHDAEADANASSARLPGLARWRDAFQISAAAVFVAVRVVGWAWAVWLLFRDTLAVLPLAASYGVRSFLRLQLAMASGFYCLQLVWFGKLIAYTRQSGLGGSVPDERDLT